MPHPPSNPLHEARRRCRPAVLAAALYSGVLNLLTLALPLHSMQVMDRVLASRSLDTLAFLTLAALGAILLAAVLEAVRGRVLARAAEWFEGALGGAAFSRGVEGALDGCPDGADALRDLAQVRGTLAGPAMLALFDVPWIPVFLIAVTALHPLFGALALAATLLLLGLAVIGDMASRRALGDAAQQGRALTTAMDATSRCATAVDAMGLLPGLEARWRALHQRVLAAQRRSGDRAGLLLAVARFARLAVQVLALSLGAWLALRHELSGGALMAGSIILSRALAPVDQAVSAWRQLAGGRQALARLDAWFARPRRRTEGMAIPDPAGRLRVERLTCGWQGSAPLLKGVSLGVEPGEVVAVVGPSGAGKSTLARALAGVLRPASGAVRLDGADLFAWPRADVGRVVGYLPQDVELPDGTVDELISRGATGCAEAVVAAARLAGCHDMILRLPQGYLTRIGTGGLRLSGGQRQRIGLARALFGGPRLIVLDEPSAHLDVEGRRALVTALERLRRDGAATVVVTHDPALAKAADRVLVLGAEPAASNANASLSDRKVTS
ncbi:type I secretion system permease/ATPase [Azospirillum sp.]|uniref:type I secretion system permease/ATPase n=1 Tax=Azospirillum sp. TaxID=34012 RepID=UPI002D721240|nr:type I secretion system permease/ATPase [Azospirillum sp.]HYD68996.1 type I secretion system permease/ATPase [Azospirillum sp.]